MRQAVDDDAFDKVVYSFKSKNKKALCSHCTQIYKVSLPFLAHFNPVNHQRYTRKKKEKTEATSLSL